MEILRQRILKDGVVKEGNILKVDSFLNHQIDISLLNEIGREFYRLFGKEKINKIITIESSGIAIAAIAAQYFHVPIVFAKKAASKNIDGEVYSSLIRSYTHGNDYTAILEKKFLGPEDRILILDDFLATGKAQLGLLDISRQAGATVAGIGIVIEKGFQGGGDHLRDAGYNLKSLAIIDEMRPDGIVFRDEESTYQRS